MPICISLLDIHVGCFWWSFVMPCTPYEILASVFVGHPLHGPKKIFGLCLTGVLLDSLEGAEWKNFQGHFFYF